MIPQFPNGHPVFDRWPIRQNYPCPVSGGQLRRYQKRVDRIAGNAGNGRSNVRVIWTADPAVAMHIVNGEPKARYGLRTDSYSCTRTDEASGLEVVEHVDVDICAPRFVFEQYHTPEEQEFNPALPDANGRDDGYYTHLFTVGYHDETCCDGREAANGQLCFGAYQEPGETHLQRLMQLIRLRDAEVQTRMPGERLTADELAQDALRLKTWSGRWDEMMRAGYFDAALSSLKLHGWRMSNTDGGKRSKYFFTGG